MLIKSLGGVHSPPIASGAIATSLLTIKRSELFLLDYIVKGLKLKPSMVMVTLMVRAVLRLGWVTTRCLLGRY
jgi:hypothetical protein